MLNSINPQLMYVNPGLIKHWLIPNTISTMSEDTLTSRFNQLIANETTGDVSRKVTRAGGKASPQAVHKWMNGGNISDENISAVAQAYGTSEAWLKYGGESKEPTPRKPAIVSYEAPEELPSGQYVMIPRRQIKLSAGPGIIAFEDREGPALAFTLDWIKQVGINPGESALAGVEGDSMEHYLQDGDTVLIALNQKDVRPFNNRRWKDRIFAIRYEGELRVKILQLLINGGLRISSVNAAEYPPEELTAEQAAQKIQIVGRSVWRAG